MCAALEQLSCSSVLAATPVRSQRPLDYPTSLKENLKENLGGRTPSVQCALLTVDPEPRQQAHPPKSPFRSPKLGRNKCLRVTVVQASEDSTSTPLKITARLSPSLRRPGFRSLLAARGAFIESSECGLGTPSAPELTILDGAHPSDSLSVAEETHRQHHHATTAHSPTTRGDALRQQGFVSSSGTSSVQPDTAPRGLPAGLKKYGKERRVLPRAPAKANGQRIRRADVDPPMRLVHRP